MDGHVAVQSGPPWSHSQLQTTYVLLVNLHIYNMYPGRM